MRWRSALGVLGALILMAACQPRPNVLEVRNAWTRPSLAGQTAAVYFVIANGTSQNDVLLSANVEVAQSAEFHMSMNEGNDVMTMAPLKEVPIPAGRNVEFAPGGYHVMLVNLSKPLQAGDTFPIQLTFQNAGALQVQVVVKEQ